MAENAAAFPDVPAFNEAFRAMVEDINGFVYAGERLESYIAVVKWLRSHPQEARFLLGPFEGDGHEPDNPQGVWCCDEHRQAYYEQRGESFG